jgi:hypothetical protein
MLTVIVITTRDLNVLLTVIATIMTIMGRSVCSTNSDVTITGRYICSVSIYWDNNREVYVQC